MGGSCAGLFGAPRTGFHAARVPWLDVALWDSVGTVALALAGRLIWGGALWAWLLGLLAAGEALHALCGVRTRVLELTLPEQTD